MTQPVYTHVSSFSYDSATHMYPPSHMTQPVILSLHLKERNPMKGRNTRMIRMYGMRHTPHVPPTQPRPPKKHTHAHTHLWHHNIHTHPHTQHTHKRLLRRWRRARFRQTVAAPGPVRRRVGTGFGNRQVARGRSKSCSRDLECLISG